MKPETARHTTTSMEQLDRIRMSEADREVARMHLQRAEFFAGLVLTAASAIGAALSRARPVSKKPVSGPRRRASA